MKSAAISPAAFAHRPNLNGTIDSICLGCFMTIRTKPTEAQLVNLEDRHDSKQPAKSLLRALESNERFH
jgi:hypothetical protein